ncbi:glycosyl hydrolase family 28-related protein [Blastococcus brunescens]|uniref:Glycosyl hydrolase family 28-related protein n=1 Tax=Blastococcus brunescens TaxID=1564165 RepID=A0ABZ1B1U6_9ACTN|nr:glycosyl hydrolase family 28-related protein [Blastococcus sp. BMG 8361]WRL64337.1 glycosyl hydrolase family 28-related protein [Blastococcus sp. BMG 8361]
MTCDGTTDNTAAIRKALADHARTDSDPLETRFAFRTLVLPSGTCLVSDILHAPGNAIALVGMGEGSTTLKLKDGAAGYGSASTPKYVYRPGIQTASTGVDNTAYANYVKDLTIDVGSGNPGAVALRWAACNSGAMERVTLRAPANSGLRGMTVEHGAGPSHVQDVTIDGFAVGIWGNDGAVNNVVFTSVTLRNQRTVAIQNGGASSSSRV